MADASVKARLQGVFTHSALAGTSADDEYAVEEFVDEHLDDLRATREQVCARIAPSLPALEAQLADDVRRFIGHCSGDLRDEVVARYLGFPFWDVLVFPLQALTGVGERDHVEIYRMSPADVQLVEADLSGMKLGHFGAFFTAPGRQRDYLVGRLHAAERLIKLLLDVRPEPSTRAVADPGADRSRVTRNELVPECIPAFEAIVLEETAALDKAQDFIAEVGGKIAELKGEAASATTAPSGGPAAGGG